MSTDQLTTELLALPLEARVDLAQALRESIDPNAGGDALGEELDAIQKAKRRAEELTSGAVAGRLHGEVLRAARRALGCA